MESKVKVTLVQALRLCTGRTADRGSRGIALLSHGHGTRRGWGVSVTPRPLFTPGKEMVPIVQEAEWDPGPIWTGAENTAFVAYQKYIKQHEPTQKAKVTIFVLVSNFIRERKKHFPPIIAIPSPTCV